VWLRLGDCGNSHLSPNDYFMTIPLPLADSTEVETLGLLGVGIKGGMGRG